MREKREADHDEKWAGPRQIGWWRKGKKGRVGRRKKGGSGEGKKPKLFKGLKKFFSFSDFQINSKLN
jgi:hypothetical protein